MSTEESAASDGDSTEGAFQGISRPPPVAASKKAELSQVLGIAAVFVPLILGIPALVLAVLGLVEIRHSDGRLQGRGAAFWGLGLGTASTVGGALLVVLLLQGWQEPEKNTKPVRPVTTTTKQATPPAGNPMDRAKALAEQGNLPGALREYGLAIKANPKDAKARYLRGVVQAGMGDLKGAMADWDVAIELASDYVEAYTDRAQARLAFDNPAGARADCDKAIELDAKFAPAYTRRAMARLEQDDHAGAIADSTRAIELAPEDAAAYLYRGLARRAVGPLDNALADLTQAIKLQPTLAPAYSSRGIIRLVQGKNQEAQADFAIFLKLRPDLKGVLQKEIVDALAKAEKEKEKKEER